MRRFTVEGTRDITIENLGDYSDAVVAALSARPDLKDLVPRWEEHLAKCDAQEAQKKARRRALNRARVAYGFADVEFDSVVKATSGETYHLAGKDELNEPYVSFFGAVKAPEICDFGEAKATAYGLNMVKKEAELLAALDSETTRGIVKGLLANLGQVASALSEAGDVREDAASALQTLDIERRQLVRKTITLIAETEVGILTQYKGRRDLVDAILALDNSAPKSRGSRSKTEETPFAETVDLPV